MLNLVSFRLCFGLPRVGGVERDEGDDVLDLRQIDFGDLCEALDDHSPGHSWWLDPATGEVVLWSDRIQSCPSSRPRLTPRTSRAQSQMTSASSTETGCDTSSFSAPGRAPMLTRTPTSTCSSYSTASSRGGRNGPGWTRSCGGTR